MSPRSVPLQLNWRKNTLAAWEAQASRRDRGTTEVPLKTLDTIVCCDVRRVSGGLLIGPPWCQSLLDSCTHCRIVVIQSGRFARKCLMNTLSNSCSIFIFVKINKTCHLTLPESSHFAWTLRNYGKNNQKGKVIFFIFGYFPKRK